MERRTFLGFSVAALGISIFSALTGCGKPEITPQLSNQEKLWNMTAASVPVNEPIDLAELKDTPVFYRDASFGKEDPNFKPKTGGG